MQVWLGQCFGQVSVVLSLRQVWVELGWGGGCGCGLRGAAPQLFWLSAVCTQYFALYMYTLPFLTRFPPLSDRILKVDVLTQFSSKWSNFVAGEHTKRGKWSEILCAQPLVARVATASLIYLKVYASQTPPNTHQSSLLHMFSDNVCSKIIVRGPQRVNLVSWCQHLSRQLLT